MPYLCQRNIQALFNAIFLAQDTIALQLINNDENILFVRKTFKVPCKRESRLFLETYEQIYHDVTPFELCLYTGNIDLLLQFIEYIHSPGHIIKALDAVVKSQQSGPDLVKITIDEHTFEPSQLTSKKLKQRFDGYNLLGNPDGIICCCPREGEPIYFYVSSNREPIPILLDRKPENKLGLNTIFKDMLLNTSRRSFDSEYSFIRRQLGIRLVRNGIAFMHDGIQIQDAIDNGHSLQNGIQHWLEIYTAAMRHRMPENLRNELKKEHWINLIGMKERFTTPFLLRVLNLVPFSTRWKNPNTCELHPVTPGKGVGFNSAILHHGRFICAGPGEEGPDGTGLLFEHAILRPQRECLEDMFHKILQYQAELGSKKARAISRLESALSINDHLSPTP